MPSYRLTDGNVTRVCIRHNSRRFNFLTRKTHRSQTPCSWVLVRRVPVNRLSILMTKIHSLFRISTYRLTRSKYGPTLKAGYVVLPVITSRPLRLPYAHHLHLAGFTRLVGGLPQAESCGDAGISGLSSVICHRMPMALPRVPARCLHPLLPWQLWPSP